MRIKKKQDCERLRRIMIDELDIFGLNISIYFTLVSHNSHTLDEESLLNYKSSSVKKSNDPRLNSWKFSSIGSSTQFLTELNQQNPTTIVGSLLEAV